MDDSEKRSNTTSTSVRKTEKISLDSSFKIVQLALDFTKNGNDLTKISEELDKKGNFPKLVKMVKKLIPTGTLSKLMKQNFTDLERHRGNSLREFLEISEKLKKRVTSAKEQDVRLGDDVKQFVQEGHMILAAVLVSEMHTILSAFATDNTAIPRSQLTRLLCTVKTYSEGVYTMKFPLEWENLITELSQKGNSAGFGWNSSGGTLSKKKRLSVQGTERGGSGGSKEGVDEVEASPLTRSPPLSARFEEEDSEKQESDKEESEEDNETHTVQIEIRGNTGGFVGSPIEFDLVVTHEDGSPVKVHATDFAVEIQGPAADSTVNITPKGKEDEGSFQIEFIPTEAGTNIISIFMNNTLLTNGIKSIISQAGEIAFLVHAKYISRGQLQGISVVPVAVPKTQTKAEVLQHTLEDIAEAEKMLEELRAITVAEMDTLELEDF